MYMLFVDVKADPKKFGWTNRQGPRMRQELDEVTEVFIYPYLSSVVGV